jgi:hypothetical protein
MEHMPKTKEPSYLHGVIPFPPMEAELARELPEEDGPLSLLRHFGHLLCHLGIDVETQKDRGESRLPKADATCFGRAAPLVPLGDESFRRDSNGGDCS